jgi:hypothetical protein
LLRPTNYDLDHCDSASVEQASRKSIKVRSKVALCFAAAWARHAPIVVSVAMSYGKLRAVPRRVDVSGQKTTEYSVGTSHELGKDFSPEWLQNLKQAATVSDPNSFLGYAC